METLKKLSRIIIKFGQFYFLFIFSFSFQSIIPIASSFYADELVSIILRSGEERLLCRHYAW